MAPSTDRLIPASAGSPRRCGRTFDVSEGSWLRAFGHERHRSLQPTEAVRRPPRRRRRLVLRRGGRDLRHPRPERRRQDHDRRVDRRPAHRPTRARSACSGSIRAGTATDCGRSSASSSRRASCRSGSPSARRSSCSPRSTPSRPTRASCIGDLGLDDQRGTAYRNLSGGQKQRLSIALALVGRPKVAILDELSTGLDPQARRETWHLIESIRDRGVTVLLVTHLMEEAERLADRVAVFGDGRVIALDTPAGIVSMVDPEQRLRFRPSVPIEDAAAHRPARGQARRAVGSDRRRDRHGQPHQRRHLRPGPTPDRGQRPPRRAGEPRRRLHRPHGPPGPHRQGAVMNEMRALILTEAKLVFREPITWLAAIALPTVILLIFGNDLRADGARSGARRPALHRGVRPVARRDHGRDARDPDPADPPRDLSREGRAAPAVDDARPPAPAARGPAGDLHGHRGHRPGPAGRRRQRRLRCPAAPPAARTTSRRSCSGMGSLFAIGLLVAALAPSSRVATAVAIPMFFVVMFLGGVYLPRVYLPDILVQDRRLHAPRRPGPPGRVARHRAAGRRRSSGWAC